MMPLEKYTYLHCLNASLTHEDFLFSLNICLVLLRKRDADLPTSQEVFLVLAVQILLVMSLSPKHVILPPATATT